MKTSSCKAKGAALCKWTRDKLLDMFILEPDDLRVTSSGTTGEDLQLSPAARKLLPIQFEMKNMAQIGVYKFYEQAQTHGNYEPVVVMKQNRSKPLVCCDAEYFFSLLLKAYG